MPQALRTSYNPQFRFKITTACCSCLGLQIILRSLISFIYRKKTGVNNCETRFNVQSQELRQCIRYSVQPVGYTNEGSWFDSQLGHQPFCLSFLPNQLCGPPNLLFNREDKSFLPGLKQLGREADHSPNSHIKVKNNCSYTPTPPYILYSLFFIYLHPRDHYK